MAKIPLYQRNQTPPEHFQLARPFYETADQSGVRQLGGAVAGVAKDVAGYLVQARVDNEISQFKGRVAEAQELLINQINANPGMTYDDMKELKHQMLNQIDLAGSTLSLPESNQYAKNWMTQNRDTLIAKVDGNIEGVLKDHEIKVLGEMGDMFLSRGDLKSYEELIKNGVKNKLIYSELEEPLLDAGRAKIHEAQKEMAVGNIKPMLIEALGPEFDKENGYKILESALGQLQESGLIDKAESADLNQKLGNWMDEFVEGRRSAERKAKEVTTQQTYNDFMSKIVSGKLTGDEVDLSTLAEKDKKIWKDALLGSYDEAPKESKFNGFKSSSRAFLRYSSGAISKQDAIESLIQARFIDKSITEQDFRDMAKRLEKPYPNYLVKEIRTALNAIENTKGMFESSRKILDSTRSLMKWVDDQYAAGKTPTAKEMFGKSSQFKADYTLADVGDVIEMKNSSWEVVGFDKDGEPWVELVR